MEAGDPAAEAHSDLHRVGRLAELPVGEFRLIRMGKAEIGVIRLADDSVHAVRNVCPHKGAPVCAGTIGGTMIPSGPGALDYGLADRVLRCPWHGFEFDVTTGHALFTDVRYRLARYPVVVRDGVVFLQARRRAAQRR